MITVFTLIELVGLDVTSLRTIQHKRQAEELFEKICQENQAHETLAEDFSSNMPDGLLRMAGDDVYAVMLFETPIDTTE